MQDLHGNRQNPMIAEMRESLRGGIRRREPTIPDDVAEQLLPLLTVELEKEIARRVGESGYV